MHFYLENSPVKVVLGIGGSAFLGSILVDFCGKGGSYDHPLKLLACKSDKNCSC